MDRKELTKTFMMISNWKKAVGLHDSETELNWAEIEINIEILCKNKYDVKS